MNPEQGAAGRRSRAVPALVIALFVLPIVVAWWLVQSDTAMRSGDLVNHGHIIQPPLDINSATASAGLRTIPLAVSEWAVILVSAGSCDSGCEERLNLLQTIRSLLGQGGTRLHVAAVVDSASAADSAFTVLVDPQARAWLSAGLGKHLERTPEHGIVFLDWRGQIMMYFPADAPPADIKADLKRLLRASAIH